jgi:parallel beta-helix repeat protein
VTVEEITFRHAANGPQAEEAALRVSGGVDGFKLKASRLFEAHGTLLGIVAGTGHRVLDSELARAGQQGFGFAGTSDTEMIGTTIHNNNMDMFDPNWEAGAGKASRVRGLTLSDNVVDQNAGPGLWCDIDCQSVKIVGNRIDHNEGAGILFEISSEATIGGNVVSECGWGNTSWGWGGGIVVSSSRSVDVTGNTLAWNADGISVISQARADRPAGSGTLITLRDNTVLAAPQPTDTEPAFLVAWLEDWAGPLYSPASQNQDWDDRYWSSQPESSTERFHWTTGLSKLASFRETPGGERGRYLTVAEKDAIVLEAKLPPTAEVHEVTQSLAVRIREAIGLLVGLGATVVLTVVALRIARLRRARRSKPGGPSIRSSAD